MSHIDLEATPALLRNDGGNRNHWLGLTLKGKYGPASAIGAIVTVKTKSKTQVLVNQWATTYLSYNDPRMHIGLGKDTVIESLEIQWMQGDKESYRNIKSNRYITIVQGKGIVE